MQTAVAYCQTPDFAAVARDIRANTPATRFEWVAKVGSATFKGTSTAFSASEAAEEVARELSANEMGEPEVWAELNITVRFRKA